MTRTRPESLVLKAPAAANNLINFWFGLLIQFVNKLRRSLIGYTSVGGSNKLPPEKAIRYNQQVLNGWLNYWQAYDGSEVDLLGKTVLELGPGADLGLGALALAKGASKYFALDVFELASGRSDAYYRAGLQHVEKEERLSSAIYEDIIGQIGKSRSMDADRFKYIINPDFNLDLFEENEIDCVFSNAAFQQFDDPTRTIKQLSRIIRPGGLFLSTIDFTSHTRWIRDRDPLNIYRYPKFIYEKLRFRGSPNRFHSSEYEKALKDNGWKNVKIFPMESYPQEYVSQVQKSFSPPFNDPNRDMSLATVVICAQNGKI
ncbi:MAG: methyltransferase domain-containing protein [Bacteroidota bacterium]